MSETGAGNAQVRAVSPEGTREAALLEQLYAARRTAAVGRLAGVLAHDFNNLLTAILGYCEMLLGDVGPEEPAHADLQEIFRSGQRAALLTKQLLAFNRHVQSLPQLLSWARLIEDLRPLLASLCGEVGLDVVVQPGGEGVEVMLDRGDASHVLFTLAWLARLTGGHSGALQLEVTGALAASSGTAPSQELRFSLPEGTAAGDTVGAIDEALRDLQDVVARSGGRLSTPAPLGAARRGTIGYPVEGALAPSGDGVATVERPLRVLVADDEAALRQVIRRMLEQSGHSVIDAASGKEALALLPVEAQGPDLLVADVMMPDMTGIELAERLVATHPAVRVLYISGYADAMSLVRRSATKKAAFLAKPFTRAQLVGAISGLE